MATWSARAVRRERHVKGDDISKRLVSFAIRVIALIDALHESPGARHVADRMLRAATSGGANYEEARGAESRRDFLHKLGVSRKEMHESYYWLRVVAGSEMLASPDAKYNAKALANEAYALCRILGKSRATAQRNVQALDK